MLHILDIYAVILLFQVGQRSTVKNYCPVNLLSVVSKVFEKLVNNMLVDHLEKHGLFSDYQYGYRSSQLTADPQTVVSGRIARAFNRSGATQAVALDISKAFERVWNASLLSSMEFRIRYLVLFRLFLLTEVFKWFWMGILHKNIQIMLEFLKAPFLVVCFSYNALMTFLIMLSLILFSVLMILLSTPSVARHLICDSNSTPTVIRHLICGSN